MTAPILTFFNNKGGVGKTSLVYHLAWMMASMGKVVLVADLDPQANLTAAFFDDDTINEIWESEDTGATIYRCVEPIEGVGDLAAPLLRKTADNLFTIPGDVRLSKYEDTLSGEWPSSMGSNNLYRPLRILSSFWQIIQIGAVEAEADIVLVDVGPNLGAINRSALIASDYVAIPLGADLFSLQGLKNLGPTLRRWRSDWGKRVANWNGNNDERNKHSGFQLPEGKMTPIGYMCQQYGVRLDKPVKAYDKWINRIPETYRDSVLEEKHSDASSITPDRDSYCLATIKHYRSLIPMAQEHRKPLFSLTTADGAIGSHYVAVQSARKDFAALAEKILKTVGLNPHSEGDLSPPSECGADLRGL